MEGQFEAVTHKGMIVGFLCFMEFGVDGFWYSPRISKVIKFNFETEKAARNFIIGHWEDKITTGESLQKKQ